MPHQYSSQIFINQINTRLIQMSPKDKFISFIKGEVPIKQLFWIYGIVILNIVIPGIVYVVRTYLLLSDMQIHILNVVTTILDLIIMVALWNASNKESLKKNMASTIKTIYCS